VPEYAASFGCPDLQKEHKLPNLHHGDHIPDDLETELHLYIEIPAADYQENQT
jgi:hypothetical protein